MITNFCRNLFIYLFIVLDETWQQICVFHFVVVRQQRSKYWLWLNSNTTGHQLHTWITIWNLTCFGVVEVEAWREYLGSHYSRQKKTVVRNVVIFTVQNIVLGRRGQRTWNWSENIYYEKQIQDYGRNF